MTDDDDDDVDNICRENQNTRFLFDNFFLLEDLAVCEIMWKILHSRTGHR